MSKVVRRTRLQVLVLSLCLSTAWSQDSPIPLDKAREAFDQARRLSDVDGGRLWGHPLYGPVLLVDPQTRFVVTNQADGEGILKQDQGVFVGTLPEKEGIANTAHTWAGTTWTMLMWPLPANPYSRGRLLMHESFHRIQNDLGLPGNNPMNNHLDTQEGRLWLRMEWRALAEALIRTGDQRRRAVGDALVFRAYRRSLFPQASDQERALELNEGIAEYTGYKLSGWPAGILADRVAVRLEQDERGTNFVRSFAYAGGPAWAVLLDEANPEWRKKLNSQADLGALLASAMKIEVPNELQAEAKRRAGAFDHATVMAEESSRAETQKQTLARNRARFMDGPVLVLPVGESFQFSFDPRNVEALGEQGTVYQGARISDGWGILEVSKGVLMVRDQSGRITGVRVPAPPTTTGRALSGDGWTLTLNDGWAVRPGARAGDFALAKDKAQQD